MVVVKVPNIQGVPWPMHGQTLRIQALISETVRSLKEKIGDQLNSMPANKQKLQMARFGVLNDSKTLGYYNLVSGVEIDLGTKERGGRKK